MIKKMPECENVDRAEIARLIEQGYTSGRLDDGEGKHINWSLNTNTWEDEDGEE